MLQKNISKNIILPNLLIIGAVKAGTSALYEYLDLHPEITMSAIKEPAFFVEEYNLRLDEYSQNWPTQNKIMGEASPQYTYYPHYKGVPERIFKNIPNVKLIYIVRDPIDRIVSHYLHRYHQRTESQSIEIAIRRQSVSLDQNNYVTRSKYFMQIEQYLNYFDRSRIFIVISEELRIDTKDTMRSVFEFLGIDTAFSHPKFKVQINTSATKARKNHLGLLLDPLRNSIALAKIPVPSIVGKAYRRASRKMLDKRPILPPDLRNDLVAVLKNDIKQLREFTGYSFEQWTL